MSLISKATEANWERLNTTKENRLTKRANKRLSKKVFIPSEYLLYKKNSKIIEKIISLVRQNNYKLDDVIYTLCLMKLAQHGLCKYDFNMPRHVLESLDHNYQYIKHFEIIELPYDEFDFVGSVYQSLKTEGSKNIQGAYYTPRYVAQDMCKDIVVQSGSNLLDPCCGTGAILLSVAAEDPSALYGCEIDPIAVQICKTNLLCRFSKKVFIPNIVCANFLASNVFPDTDFSFIATNPPWGADSKSKINYLSEITSGESASYFLEKSIKIAGSHCSISFLLPKSMLNIAIHSDIRELILRDTRIVSIKQYSNLFSGVTTEIFNIVLVTKEPQKNKVMVFGEKKAFMIDPKIFQNNHNSTFTLLLPEDIKIKEKVKSLGRFTLESNSIWALGIVTGNNKEKVFDKPVQGSEPIYTGKEIEAFKLKTPQKYIVFNPDNFQQCARENIYRAPEKLVYKFISKKLTFALDCTGALCLNSANILIPNISELSIKTVAALLNSMLYQYLYLVMFDDPKILKSNLCKLPLPYLSGQTLKRLDNLVNQYISSEIGLNEIDREIFDLFEITSDEEVRIREVVYGTTK